MISGENMQMQSEINRNKFQSDNVSVRGYSHLIINKECQDNSISWKGVICPEYRPGRPPKGKPYCGVVVCDGHGGEKYFRSAIGSKIACAVGKKCIDNVMKKIQLTPSNYKRHLDYLENEIVKSWRNAVLRDFADHPFEQDSKFDSLPDESKAGLSKSPIKAYGSTFIAAVMTNTYYFVIKLGDGNASVINYDGKASLLQSVDDSQLEFNITTSLCQTDAVNEFRHIYVSIDNDMPIKGLVLTTDGIINCYTNEQAYLDFISNIFSGYKEETLVSAHAELEEFLPRLSEKGSGDDLSVGIILRD